jgi:Ca2+-binding EF-hand superfamily protein
LKWLSFPRTAFKKDRNLSDEVQYILNSNVKRSSSKLSSAKDLKSVSNTHMEQLLEFVWMKIEEKFTRIADAFRFFLNESGNTVSKREFRDGLLRLKIKISLKDFESVFEYLDKHGIGYFTYNQF